MEPLERFVQGRTRRSSRD